MNLFQGSNESLKIIRWIAGVNFVHNLTYLHIMYSSVVQLFLTQGYFPKRDNLRATSNKMIYKRTDSQDFKPKREDR